MSILLSSCVISVLFKKLFSMPIHSRLSPTFSSIIFSVSSFMLKYLIHLCLSFVQVNRHESTCVLLHTSIQLDQAPFVEDAFFFPLYISDFFTKNQVYGSVSIYICVFDLIPLINVYVFMAIPCCFFIIIALYYIFKLGMLVPPEFFYYLGLF